MEDPNDEIWVKISGGDNEKGLTKHRVKKMYRYVSQQCLSVLTSLILCIEQGLSNQYNPVKQQFKQQQLLAQKEESKDPQMSRSREASKTDLLISESDPNDHFPAVNKGFQDYIPDQPLFETLISLLKVDTLLS